MSRPVPAAARAAGAAPGVRQHARPCAGCLRRTWLLGRLAGRIELARHGRPPRAGGRLRDVLALADEELLAALAGSERPAIEQELPIRRMPLGRYQDILRAYPAGRVTPRF